MGKTDNRLYIVMYHYIRDLKNTRYPDIRGLELSIFRRQLDYFEQFFHVVTMEEVMEAVNGSGRLPENAMLLTFDDGYIDNYLLALPLLMEHHMQGSFFIPGKILEERVLLDVNKLHFILATARTGELFQDLLDRMEWYRESGLIHNTEQELMTKYLAAGRFDDRETVFIKRMLQMVLPEQIRNQITSELFKKYVGVPENILANELYMNYDQVRMLKKMEMFIGFHGYDHYWLAELPVEDMRRDIRKGIDVIGEFIDDKNWVINYPYGNYNEAVYNCAAGLGANLGLTTEVRVACPGRDMPMTLPRLDCNDFLPGSNQWKYLL